MPASGLIHNKNKGAGGRNNLKGLFPSYPEASLSCPDLLKFCTIAGIGLILVLFLCFISLAHATEEWTNEKIADAIYLAEGGRKAISPFGILSVKCEGYDACRRICLNTIHNQRIRHSNHNCRLTFLECLANRYAPTKNATNDPNKLNRFWLSNIRYFLENPK